MHLTERDLSISMLTKRSKRHFYSEPVCLTERSSISCLKTNCKRLVSNYFRSTPNQCCYINNCTFSADHMFKSLRLNAIYYSLSLNFNLEPSSYPLIRVQIGLTNCSHRLLSTRQKEYCIDSGMDLLYFNRGGYCSYFRHVIKLSVQYFNSHEKPKMSFFE